MRSSYCTGSVRGIEKAGGLLGLDSEDWTVANCFWDTQTSGQSTSAGGTGLTTAEMQTAEKFIEAGWDFVGETENGAANIWHIQGDVNYPTLYLIDKLQLQQIE